jgi:hypothetical protein
MKMTAFWDIVPCSLVEVDRRFRGEYFILLVDSMCTLRILVSKNFRCKPTYMLTRSHIRYISGT